MTPEQFVYWLQGYFELSEETTPVSVTQVKTIKNHLNLVFAHIDAPDPTGALTAAHQGLPKPNPTGAPVQYRC